MNNSCNLKPMGGGGNFNTSEILTEVTPLSDCDFFYMVDRTKDAFTFPVHKHHEFEINYVENCAGARRIVGDSVETVSDFDLCIVGHGIEHGWEQADCHSNKIREVTIQFPEDIFGDEMLRRTQMASIKRLLENSSKGVAFPLQSIMRVFNLIQEMLAASTGFDKMIKLIEVLHSLGSDPEGRQLSSSSFSAAGVNIDSRRLKKTQDYINQHYRSEIRLNDLASIAGMSPSSFSRFFKLRTGRSISDYIISIRLGIASRELMSTTKSISEICYNSGFNNVSNFNRIFKKNKGYTPKEFREIYKRHKILI